MLAPHGRPQNIFFSLSLKIVKISTIYMNHFVGVRGVQNCQAGCYRRVPFMAPTKGGVRHGAELLVIRQQRTGGR